MRQDHRPGHCEDSHTNTQRTATQGSSSTAVRGCEKITRTRTRLRPPTARLVIISGNGYLSTSQACLTRETGESVPLFLNLTSHSRQASNTVCRFFGISVTKIVDAYTPVSSKSVSDAIHPKNRPLWGDETSILIWKYLPVFLYLQMAIP